MRVKIFAAGILALLLCWAPLAWAGGAGCPRAVSRFAAMDGHKLHYWEFGKGDTALLLIHGWACDASFWQGQFKALGASYRIIAPDLIGHGLSDKPEVNYDFKLFVRGLKAVLDHAGVKKAVACGHSMGGSLAWQLALADKRVTGVVLVDGAFMVVPRQPEARKKWRQGIQAFVGGFKHPGYREAVQNFIFSLLGPAITPGLTVRIVEGMLKTPSHVALGAMQNFAEEANWELKPIQQPVLALYAKGPDTTREFKKMLAVLFPKLEYHEINGHGHFFLLEKPELLNRPLASFLAKHKLPGGK